MSHQDKDVRVYTPEQDWSDLLHQHLSLRQEMMRDLGIGVGDRLSWDDYVQREQNFIVLIRQELKRKFVLWGMWQAWQFELNPKSEWWGAYQRE
ncbi:MAG: hypothetical protein AAGG51_09915 [Cyanobacteria bacterium P01_G01_bin.54]